MPRLILAPLAVVAVCALASCGGGGGSDPASDTSPGATLEATATTTAALSPVPSEPAAASTAPETTVSAPIITDAVAPPPTADVVDVVDVATTDASTAGAAVVDPLDDLDEDGAVDEACGQADLGGGLVVATLCNEYLRPTPEGGVEPTAGSLLWLPAPPRWDDLADVDASLRTARTTDGRRVVIYVLGSDTLFDSGADRVRPTAAPPLEAIVASIASRFPDAPITIRGAADSVGSPDANQLLSERRAIAVAAEMTARGIDPARVSTVGLGSTTPVALETAADGSVNDIGRQVNRRVEIVVG